MPTPKSAFATTPCVGRCSTIYGDLICRGCKRFMTEVMQWNQFSLAQKTQVWQRLDELAVRVIPLFCSLHDEARLTHFLQQQQIRYPSHLSWQSFALHCIEHFDQGLDCFEQTGLLVHDPQIKQIGQLKRRVQVMMFELSTAEHQRHYPQF